MSCDNIEGNGVVARRVFTSYARLVDPDLADWITENTRFPNSMVDRITPVTTPPVIDELSSRFDVQDRWPVVAEPFTTWVLEDDFADGRPPLEDAGVHVVDDVAPYELMKLRLLNASHQGLCYFGYLMGYRYVHDAAQDPLIARFLLNYMDLEAIPTLRPVPGIDLTEYTRTLIERFANPEIRDTIARLCAESSDRIPKWLLPVIRENLAHGGNVVRSAAIVARGPVTQRASTNTVSRSSGGPSCRAAGAARAEATHSSGSFIENTSVFGDLARNTRFVDAYTWALNSLHNEGAKGTLEALPVEPE